ncbi:MAG: M3 family metallopeptidase [Leptolyngbyaceae cyanobacterium SM1_1_3]|nr:M3 family metallopeptidase [Leptolyngbyaceae cyanobacterium SM1_1_3]NJN01100.1 M3 family metallopeptidase [Leptolyngbyaceae cyanobacterium RM1_1_2]NJO10766.1 M3 family metallopeptidase [Leptolyngbyaceae cyanobacterium SL_1_1]
MSPTVALPEETVQNPLLIGAGLPPFEAIQPEHIVPGMTQLLDELARSLKALEVNVTPTWEDLVKPLTQISERLSWSWGIIGHLMGVKNSPKLRQAYEAVQPSVIQFATQLGQSQPLYEAFKQIRAGSQWEQLEPAQQRIVETAIQEAELSGVGLEGEAKEQFNQIQQTLAELSTKFSNNVLDATKAFSLTLTTPAEIAGLPPSLLAQAAQAAREAGDENATAELGPWRITLDYPSYVPFLQHSRRRDLREKLYRAFVTRAASGDLNNTPNIERILELRQQQATLLGYKTYAELSIARKMAPSVEAVEKLMEELRSVSYEAAKQDLADLEQFAQAQAAPEADSLMNWDTAFWAERLRETKYELTDEELRPYFPLPQVLEGLFNLAQRLFGVTITAADGEAPVWHPDVRYFKVADETGSTLAHFYLDPYSRPTEKRGGAWMDDCLNRGKFGERLRLPVAYLVCNQSPPVDGKPSLMTFRDVETLFHEFGHGLQHMLTQVDYPGAAGINNVEWDAVELPSQFMENWCYHRDTLFKLARHYETGEPLPEDKYQRLLEARNFMTGSAILRQVNFGWLDIELHHRYQPRGSESIWDVRDRLAEKTTVLKPIPEDAFLCAFSHIFAGGYAAGYYSYFWAEVLSADAFAAFEEAGLDDEAVLLETGRRFRDTVLALGGSRHPMEVFKAFRGREPSTAALLRHRGLVSAA